MLLSVKSLTKRFGGLTALSSINFNIEEGETVGMIGPNGSGKTTFVNVTSGFLKSDLGRVYFRGQNVTKLKPYKLASLGLARTFQATRVFGELTVWENMIAANIPHYQILNRDTSTDGIHPILERLELLDKYHERAAGLTLYDQKRLEIAMRLVAEPRLLMLDEPVGGLSPTEILEMLSLLKNLRQERTLFIIEHTMKVIFNLANRVIVLNGGLKLAEGSPIEISKNQAVIEAYLGQENYFEETAA